MNDELVAAFQGALDAMRRAGGPRNFAQLVAPLIDPPSTVGDPIHQLVEHLRSAPPADPLKTELSARLGAWDSDDTGNWIRDTAPGTPERRELVATRLGLTDEISRFVNAEFPILSTRDPIIIADDWEEWRTPANRSHRDFYWAHYRDFLLNNKKWDLNAVDLLDRACEKVVSRISEPTRPEAYQARGLVIGYVQSGKTANFTGVIAKAIDAGYRLIIVLTGTTNMLRAQTQRRLDLELCGRENLELEISPGEPHEYEDDPDWTGSGFNIHGGRPSAVDRPDIRRLTTRADDYKALKQGFSTLDFSKDKRDRKLPLYDTSNLYTADARLVVAKKQKTALENLVKDLRRVKGGLGEVPALIIDDESDQASVNTTSPRTWSSAGKKRTAINQRIGDLLRQMPRAQYVGYTATPYANVFIDPSDAEDIFPRNFLIALDRPDHYMGAEDFQDDDTEVPPNERPLTSSRERAHVRFLSDEPDDNELRDALDTFVLTAAVKAHRERVGGRRFRHHTMLVHEAMGRESHRETAALLKNLWNTGDYHGPDGLSRLRRRYIADILPVSRATAADLPTPENFDDLRQDLERALERITPPHGSPVIIVNSDKDLENNQEELDFDRRSIWRILVGGNKLARGFTVEGLTITYYRRAAGQVDTLMQMGRWFGFRPHYRDLVRLYTTTELHDMFRAASDDENHLRNELRRYSRPGPLGKTITPRQIPPLIAQHRPDLRPTARTKMWNARITRKSSAGDIVEKVAYPGAGSSRDLAHNTDTWLGELAGSRTASFPVPGTTTRYNVHYTEISHARMIDLLETLKWRRHADDTLRAELAWLRDLTPEQLERWIIFVPRQSRGGSTRTIRLSNGSTAGQFSVFERSRSTTGALKVASEKRHRSAAFHLVGIDTNETRSWSADPVLTPLRRPATAVAIVYPTVTSLGTINADVVNSADITTAFCLITPYSTAPGDDNLITWQVIDTDRPDRITLDRPA